MPELPQVHAYSAGEAGLAVNAYLVETEHGVVAVDATLTVSDSRALRARADALGKPLLAVLVTHAHPDHVAGITELVGDRDVPILALPSVEHLMRAFEEPKRAQWGPVFGAEWVGAWTYPNWPVRNGEAVSFDGATFRVHDLGPGGDCDANSIWVLEGAPRAAFVGDLVFNGTHVYTADGRILAWLANLERFRPLLVGVPTLYPGHGQPGDPSLLDQQRDYLLAYCAAVRDLSGGMPSLTEEAKRELAERMGRFRPRAPLGFMVALGADAVAAELVGPR